MAEAKAIATRDAYGEALAELGEAHEDIVVLDADLSKSTKTCLFAEKFPGRFFDCGIAEANMMCIAAGLANAGKVPFASSFCIFAAGRAWDQVRNTIAYSGLNVKIVGTHGGVSVGPDGASHEMIEDLALMRAIPGMTVVCPCDGPETTQAINAAYEFDGPVFVRLGRAKVPVVTSSDDAFRIGRGRVLREGDDVTVIACGALVAEALDAADVLAGEGTSVRVVDMHTLKPLDDDLVADSARRTGALVTAEEHVLEGGLGCAVAQVAAETHQVPIEFIAIRNRFGQSGEPKELFQEYGLTAAHIAKAARTAVERKV